MNMLLSRSGIHHYCLLLICLILSNVANSALKVEIINRRISQSQSMSTSPLPSCFIIAFGIDATLRVTNTGRGNLSNIQPLINPVYTNNVTVSNTCPATLGASASCDITLVHTGVYGGPLTCEVNHVIATPNADVIFNMAVSG